MTGIPVEALFSIIGGMVTLVYLDLRREVRTLRKESQTRTVQLTGIRFILASVCKKLDIPFTLEQ
jgi:hypothetical protein